MKDALKEHLLSTPPRKFYLGRISKCEFGIVCPDRANFLGLQFEVIEVESDCGTSVQHLDRNFSLKLLERYGRADNLNGKYCWMFSEGSGSSIQRFVCLQEDLYVKD